ncbi:MAG: Zn-dependent exopeptidase M28, partial [Clostridiales bacterium]|nr:Zn-dependent exopeptidase M28 [Clostridiales bacterium]
GSEEAGLRGAQAFAKKHKAAGDGLITDVETIYISMDTMREIEQLQVYTMGCTGTVRSSEPVGDLLREAGLNCGVDMPRAALYPGAVDSDGFAQHGLTAAGFCGVNHDPKKYYHTREDTADNISPECIDISLKICMEAAELYDKNGGIAKYGEKYNK